MVTVLDTENLSNMIFHFMDPDFSVNEGDGTGYE